MPCPHPVGRGEGDSLACPLAARVIEGFSTTGPGAISMAHVQASLFHRISVGVGLAIAALGASSPALAQSNVIWPNDECAFATPIAGDGSWQFDTSSPF